MSHILSCGRCGWTADATAFHLGCQRCGDKHSLAEQMPAYQESAVETTEAESDEVEAEAGASDEDS
jgi:hypothetical protein